MQSLRVLLVEDEQRLAENLKQGLGDQEIGAECVPSAERAETLLESNSYDVIVLDLGLPGKDGLQFLREIRQAGNASPVLILTARGALEERVAGLEAGGDDYLAKPFALAELVARIRALARRSPSTAGAPTILRVADLEFDAIKRRAKRAGRPIALSPKEAILLELLMRRAGETVTRDMIAETVWDSDYNVFGNLIEVFVNRLRHKVDRDSDKPLISTVRGVGYSIKTAQ
ncbi:MAG TPA: response regulator transcription factor [Candidatus Binataceae bacterium]|nr:response regulator transcription factor [Candidatus Binataceae bacterium]